MSPATRMYLPLERRQVAELQKRGHLEPGLVSFGVTSGLRASAPDGDDELWEFLALQQAAHYAKDHRRPIVIAAVDIEDDLLGQSAGQASGLPSKAPLGRTSVPLALKDLASLHLGDDALGGGPDQPADDQPPHPDRMKNDPFDMKNDRFDLSWFDSTEVAQVVRLLSAPQETSTWMQ